MEKLAESTALNIFLLAFCLIQNKVDHKIGKLLPWQKQQTVTGVLSLPNKRFLLGAIIKI